MDFRSRIAQRLEMEKEDLPFLEKNLELGDANGSATNTLALTHRFLGVAQYLLEGRASAFRSCLSRASDLRASLIERFDSGNSIDDSYVSILSYKFLFDSLAAGDIVLAERLARLLGGRRQIESRYDHEFDRALGYSLRSCVRLDRRDLDQWLPRFAAQCKSTATRPFVGLVMAFEGFRVSEARAVNDGLSEFCAGYGALSRPGMPFHLMEDEGLNVWGIGFANLARAHGIATEPRPPLIPSDLLISIGCAPQEPGPG